jgi:sigma-E factor negative regulatory protein RseC
MAIEHGIVTRLGTQSSTPTAWVKIIRSSACEACSSRHSCNAGRGGDDQEVETVNEVRAGIGDHIQVVMNTGSLLKATFLLYLFPILCMLVGGLTGDWVSMRLNIQGSALSVLLAVVFLGSAMLIVRIKGQRMGKDRAYRPRVLRVIGRRRGINGTDNEAVGVDSAGGCSVTR